jgi:hypothetical protein
MIALSMINDPAVQAATVAISKFTGANEQLYGSWPMILSGLQT